MRRVGTGISFCGVPRPTTAMTTLRPVLLCLAAVAAFAAANVALVVTAPTPAEAAPAALVASR